MSFIARTRRCMMPPPCPPFCYSKARFISELFVKKLSFYTTENDLKNMFSPFGVVKDARLIVDPKTRRHKGFGFVTFETEIEAQKAVKALDARIVKGRMIFVEFAKARTVGGDHSGK
ncbi:hypothetical protein Droror1_Dr00004331 [Drosera rotundifolia]